MPTDQDDPEAPSYDALPVAGTPGGTTKVNRPSYSRDAACAYAEHFAEKVCHDGATVGKNAIDRDKLDFSFVDDPVPIDENDCTHFVSCCIGAHRGKFTRISDGKSKSFPLDSEDVLPGGGVSLEQDSFANAYGMFGAPRLARYLVNKKRAVLVTGNLIPYPNDTATTVVKLEAAGTFVRGDVVVYAHAPDLGSAGHMALYVGNGQICCHTENRKDKPIDAVDPQRVHYSYVALLHIVG